MKTMSQSARSVSESTTFAPDAASGFGFRVRAVPHRDVASRLREALGHRVSHAADADPAELVFLHVCHCILQKI